MNIAIHNIHKLPNLTNAKIHNYGLELVRQGHVPYLFFDNPKFSENFFGKMALLKRIKKQYKLKELGLDKARIITTSKSLNKYCDVLLNFNSTEPDEFTPAVKNFKGLKIFHLMDYFWLEPGSEKYKRLKEYGVDYVMSYCRPDLYCTYFQTYFPDYIGKVIPVPFGFAPRFVNNQSFESRKDKCVALGSVNPLRPQDSDPKNYIESATFFKNEEWFHKFRRMIVENMDRLGDVIDSMLPVFPKYKDNKYDLVKKVNEYKLFVSDESIFYFPSAKTFEGPAAGCVMVCSDHPCFKEYGFIDGVNCITHKQFDIDDMKRVIQNALKNPEALKKIQETSYTYVTENYSHQAVALKLYKTIEGLFTGTPKEKPVRLSLGSKIFNYKVYTGLYIWIFILTIWAVLTGKANKNIKVRFNKLLKKS